MAVAVALTVPATLCDLLVSPTIEQAIDANYPRGLHIALRLMSGTLLALLVVQIWPRLQLRRVCLAAMWLGVLLFGADLCSFMAIEWAGTAVLGSSCPSWLKWSGATLWITHFSLAALVIQQIIEKRPGRDSG